jgi:hypothetical protein
MENLSKQVVLSVIDLIMNQEHFGIFSVKLNVDYKGGVVSMGDKLS